MNFFFVFLFQLLFSIISLAVKSTTKGWCYETFFYATSRQMPVALLHLQVSLLMLSTASSLGTSVYFHCQTCKKCFYPYYVFHSTSSVCCRPQKYIQQRLYNCYEFYCIMPKAERQYRPSKLLSILSIDCFNYSLNLKDTA